MKKMDRNHPIPRPRERGIALPIALILLGLLLSFTALSATLVTSEARQTFAQYNNTRAFNVGMAHLELMTQRINELYSVNPNPTLADIQNNVTDLSNPANRPRFSEDASGTPSYDFASRVYEPADASQRIRQVTVQDPPYDGLAATERNFFLETVTRDKRFGGEVRLVRQVANYQVPVFQFAAFAFDNLELFPGPDFFINGRVHTNRTLFLGGGGNINMYGRVTARGQIATKTKANGIAEGGSGYVKVFDANSSATDKMVNIVNSLSGPTDTSGNQRNPDDPTKAEDYDYNYKDDPTLPNVAGFTINNSAKSGPTSVTTAKAPRLQLPTEQKGFSAIEILRRTRYDSSGNMVDDAALQTSRYSNGRFNNNVGTTIRILIDDDLLEFPPAIGSEPRAYDLGDAGNVATAMGLTSNPNVRRFDPLTGSDNPNRAAAAVTRGDGGSLGTITATDAPQQVLPPQTNLINAQSEVQTDSDGNAVAGTNKRTFIKIELVVNNPDDSANPYQRIDITPHILGLGITHGPIPTPKVDAAAGVGNLAALEASLNGDGNTLSPDGILRATTTYAYSYALNDGRRTNTTTDAPENMLPFIENSAGDDQYIGQWQGTSTFTAPNPVGTFPAATLNLRGTNMQISMSYRFEGNSILRMQRTFVPFQPNAANLDVTLADIQTTDDTDGSAVVGSVTTGRVGGNNYPAKFKSLIAKPYFRYVDQFDNRSYIKRSQDLSTSDPVAVAVSPFPTDNGNNIPLPSPFPSPAAKLSNGLYGLANPFDIYSDVTSSASADSSRNLYNDPNLTAGSPTGTTTRFIRYIDAMAANVTSGGGNYGQPASGQSFISAAGGTGVDIPNQFIFDDNSIPPRKQPDGVGNIVTGATLSLAQIWRGFVSPTTSIGGNAGLGAWNLHSVNTLLSQRLRETVFKPGIPGFYALKTSTPTSNVITGDNRPDIDVDFNYPNALPNAQARPGVVDLQEMTVFANQDPGDAAGQQRLRNYRTNIGVLTQADFPHLGYPTTTNNLPNYFYVDPNNPASGIRFERRFGDETGLTADQRKRTFLGSLYPVEKGLENAWGSDEIPKENLRFDWNGDGIIEVPHRPFQTGVPNVASNPYGSLTDGAAIGYSVESNIASLIPSSLQAYGHRLSLDPSILANVDNNLQTSVPVEIRFVEADAGVPYSTYGSGVNLPSGLTAESATLISGQTDPDIDKAATTTQHGFRNGWNSFRVVVPARTFRVNRQFTGGRWVAVRTMVRMIFQCPLAAFGEQGRLPNSPSAAVAATEYRPHGTAIGFTAALAAQRSNEAEIGRRIGLTDANFAYPGHVYMDFLPQSPATPNVPASNPPTFLPRARVVMDQAFPINTYDQREGRHVNRRYGYINIPTAADYYNADVGGSNSFGARNALWPNWPDVGAAAGQLNDTDRILADMVGLRKSDTVPATNFAKLPMPSPVALERRGVLSVIEFDMGNFKRLFRGDFDTYLGTVPASAGGSFTTGQPLPGPAWNGNGAGKINIANNGVTIYISDRRGDDNNDGMYEFNDVYGEDDSLDALDNVFNVFRPPLPPSYAPQDPAVAPDSSGDQTRGRPGDFIRRRDVQVETQPNDTSAAFYRTGEAPHGSMPVNDGFEYFSPNILTVSRRTDTNGAPLTAEQALLDGTGANAGTFLGLNSGITAATQTGALNWRIVDSAKTGRVRAFRRAVRLVNATDIARWYVRPDGAIPQHFTGVSFVTENPLYLHGNVNSIGVSKGPGGGGAPAETQIDLGKGGIIAAPSTNVPTVSYNFLQTGNTTIAGSTSDFTPSLWTVSGSDRYLHGPFAVMADGVWALSRLYSDGRHFLCPYSTGNNPGTDPADLRRSVRAQSRIFRTPVETTVKAAWLAGQPKSGVQASSNGTLIDTTQLAADPITDAVLGTDKDRNDNGGLHNYPRFCEAWSGRFNYNGSFIFQFYSHQANGQWLIGVDTQYGAPTRNWSFDTGFITPGGLPPNTPAASFSKIKGFRQIFLEDNPQ